MVPKIIILQLLLHQNSVGDKIPKKIPITLPYCFFKIKMSLINLSGRYFILDREMTEHRIKVVRTAVPKTLEDREWTFTETTHEMEPILLRLSMTESTQFFIPLKPQDRHGSFLTQELCFPRTCILVAL